jgi:kumamolisin
MAAATLAPAAAIAASTAASSPPATVSVPQGISAAALPHAAVFGNTAASTPETVSFVLKARNLDELKALAVSGRSGLSVRQFAARYGAGARQITALEGYLKQFGLTASSYADGLDVTATGTAGQFDSALSVQQKNYSVPAVAARNGQAGISAQDVHGTTQNAVLPANVGTGVLAVLGLTNYSAFTTGLVHTLGNTDRSVTASELAAAKSTKLTQNAVNTGTQTPADFAANYDLGPLYAKGATGAGQTIGIVTLAGLDPVAPEYFWNNVLGITTKPDRITVDNVDGGPGAPNEQAGSGESDLDVEQSGALAPQANIVVYQAPNTDSGYADAFFAAASANAADTLSTSWGESETYLRAAIAAGQTSPGYQFALDEAFLEFDVQGQSAFASSGDAGAYDASRDLGTTNLSADNPSDSPYITAAGGTTLAGTIPLAPTLNITIAQQRAWGWDYLWPYYAGAGATSEAAFAEELIGGGGGGYSVLEPRPAYQRGLTWTYRAVQYLTPASYASVSGLNLPTAWTFNATPAVTTGFGNGGRAVPDLSADADPFTGYLLYDPLAATSLAGGWGGTSFVAPQLNGSAALIDQLVGHRVGFWNPRIYALAASGNSPFTPLSMAGTANDNLYYTGTPGSRYNPATGLGVPDFAKLANDLAG